MFFVFIYVLIVYMCRIKVFITILFIMHNILLLCRFLFSLYTPKPMNNKDRFCSQVLQWQMFVPEAVILIYLSLSCADQHIHSIHFMNFKLCFFMVFAVIKHKQLLYYASSRTPWTKFCTIQYVQQRSMANTLKWI